MSENSSGFTNEQSPQGGALSGDLLDQNVCTLECMGRYRGIRHIFLILIQNIDCVYTLEPAGLDGSNVYPISAINAFSIYIKHIQ